MTYHWSKSDIIEADAEYVIHSWSKQGGLNARPIERAEGVWFWDYDGNRYLDFQSQLVNSNLGHQHPRVVKAIQDQADRLTYIGPNFAEENRSRLAQKLAEVTPGDLKMSFFTTGGADANENAVKLARRVTGRHKVIARYRSYHGASSGAISLTGDPRRWAAEPGTVPGVVRMLDPYTYRCPMGHPDPCPVCEGGPHLEELLMYEDPETVAAVIMEPVTGTNGLIYPSDNYLRSIREVCNKYGIILIFDEVMSGFGRSGELFACNHWNVTPDILVTAKGLNSGYVPLGAMTVNERISSWLMDKKLWGGLTYAGHPLACASALAALDVLEEEQLVENSREQGKHLEAGLLKLADKHPSIGDIRGRGLFYGLELVRDRATREPLVPFNPTAETIKPMKAITQSALANGLYLSANNNIIRLTPPLIIDRPQIDFALEVLDDVLQIADNHYSGDMS